MNTRMTIIEGLSVLGGLQTITGVILVVFLSGYQQFNLDQVLMKHLYSEEPYLVSGKDVRSNEQEFLQRVQNRRPFSYSYCGYRCTKIASKCWCCLKLCVSRSKRSAFERRLRKMKMLERARQMLSQERDMEDMLYMKRMVRLMIKSFLTIQQQACVQYFSKYVIKDSNLRSTEPEAAMKKREYKDTELWESLQLETSAIDRLILYEVTRRRYPGTENDENFSETD